MAGTKLSKTKDEQTKKRKRDVNESDKQAKRSKGAGNKNKANRNERDDAQDDVDVGAPEIGPSPHNALVSRNSSVGDVEVVNQFDHDAAGWRISKPMGGRMLDIDPILTADEQYLIITYNTSIQVFGAADSLLIRRIPITSLDTSAEKGTTAATIVGTRLSYSNPECVWVACTDGMIYNVNWKASESEIKSFKTTSGTAKALAVVPGGASKNTGDVLLVTESEKSSRMDVVAYGGDLASSPSTKTILSLTQSGNGLQLIEATQDGRILVGGLNDRLIIGTAKHGLGAGFDKLQYDFVSFDVADLITSIDVRVYPRPGAGKNQQKEQDQVVDVAVGGARGAIYVYRDAVARSQNTGKSPKEGIEGQKFHWHRRAVHSVKWSRDGNYMISGGSEQVLVMWQMDTGKRDYLPHLSGSVENIVISASGSSYVVHLDDNSTMILSTAELKPTAYISGIQSAAVDAITPKDLLVQRVWSAPDKVRRPIPAAIRPNDPSKLHVCVGNGRQATMSGEFSAPLLQSFDLETFMSVSKQPLARTQPTSVNMTNKGHVIDEPVVTHIAFSGDGKWLASIDDWVPSARDVENVSSDIRDQFIKERHEIYLKFWTVNESDQSISLVSRINAPHALAHPEAVLDLAANNASTCFATIGADGIVRIWRPKSRQQFAAASKGAKAPEYSWGCSQVIPVGDGLGEDAIAEISGGTSAPAKTQGRIAFSEDGSTLFAAFGAVSTGSVYVIDTESGQIIKTVEGLWKGQLQAVRTLSQYVIVLSEELHVYDIVADDLRYGIVIPNVPGVNELLQMAVDPITGCFAVTLPLGDISSVGIFHPEEPEPIIVRSTPHRIISLVSSPGTSGFIALDDVAQIWVISEGTDPLSLPTAQPLEDLPLDATPEENGRAIVLSRDEESDDEMDGAQNEDEDGDVDMDDDDSAAIVVPQQHLTEIFDAAPAFAGASVEDMFYKVTSLLATKPLSAATA